MKTDYIAENILISILAVNGWSADRVFPLTERFRAVGLLDFAAVSGLSIEDIAERLVRAGYARGEYMNQLLGTRVLSMGDGPDRFRADTAQAVSFGGSND